MIVDCCYRFFAEFEPLRKSKNVPEDSLRREYFCLVEIELPGFIVVEGDGECRVANLSYPLLEFSFI